MKSVITRMSCFALVVLMLISMLASCSLFEKEETESADDSVSETERKTDDSDVTESGSDNSEATESQDVIEYDENGYQKDKIEDRDLGGKEIRILAWTGGAIQELDVKYSDIGANALSKQVYLRNDKVSRRLGVNLMFINTAGNNASYANTYIPKAEELVMANAVDAFACYSMAATPMMLRGYLSNR